jgi:transposase
METQVKIERRPVTIPYKEARRVVLAATDKGMAYEEMAALCKVSTGTVKRWMATGRAKRSAILPLVQAVGREYISAATVSEALAALYRERNCRFCIYGADLARLAGRKNLRTAFLQEIETALDDAGFCFVRRYVNGQDAFFMIRWRHLERHVGAPLPKQAFEKYFQTVADSIEDDGAAEEN